MDVWIVEIPHALHDGIDCEEAKPLIHVFTPLIPSELVPWPAAMDCTCDLVLVCLVPEAACVR